MNLQWAVIDLPDFSYAGLGQTYRLTQPVLDAFLPWIDPVWLQKEFLCSCLPRS